MTVKESGHQYPEDMREPTGPELDMWDKIVSTTDQKLISMAGSFQKIGPLRATPEEVFCAVSYYERCVYMAADDVAVLRTLDGFAPSLARDELRRGLIGTFLIPIEGSKYVSRSAPAKVFASRDVPAGYFLSADEEVDGLIWATSPVGRTVIPPLTDRADLSDLLWRVRPLMVDRYRMAQSGHEEVRLRGAVRAAG